MGLFQRTADIVAANLNDLADRCENPESMLRHALREIEAAEAGAAVALARGVASERLLAKTADEHRAGAERWQARAVAALESGDETLARRAIARQLSHEQSAGALAVQIEQVQATSERLRGRLEAIRGKQAEARNRYILLSARQQAAAAQRQAYAAAPRSTSRGFARFERYCERLELAEAETMALADLATETAALETEFARREGESRVNAEFERLKAQRATSR